jgi:acyl dehydratase
MQAGDDLREGAELPSLCKGPVTRQMLVEWCAAENDYFPLHYDERMARQMSLPGTPIQGTYRYALMGQMICRWLQTRATAGAGSLVRIGATYRGLDLEGDVITARGRISGVAAVPGGEALRAAKPCAYSCRYGSRTRATSVRPVGRRPSNSARAHPGGH